MKVAALSLLLVVIRGCAMTPQQGEAMSQLGAAMLSGYPQPYQSYRPVALYQGERVSGLNKMCFYSRVGSIESYNFPSASICPLQMP
jgi:hypothetical protein